MRNTVANIVLTQKKNACINVLFICKIRKCKLPMNSLEILIMEETKEALRKYLTQKEKNRKKTYTHYN